MKDLFLWQHPKSQYWHIKNQEGNFLSSHVWDLRFTPSMFNCWSNLKKESAQKIMDEISNN